MYFGLGFFVVAVVFLLIASCKIQILILLAYNLRAISRVLVFKPVGGFFNTLFFFFEREVFQL